MTARLRLRYAALGRAQRRVLLFVGALVLGGASAAFAFMTVPVDNSGCTNCAVASAASLSPPTTPTATETGATTITVGWTLPSSQISGARYQVTRTSPTNVAVCTVAAPTTSCPDTGLSAGTTYAYSILAVHYVAGVADNWQSPAVTTSATTLGVITSSLPGDVYGTAYSTSLAATGGSGGYTWTVSSGSLPSWATLDAGTGKITGNPTAAATTSGLQFTVKDSNNFTAVSGSLSITVNQAPLTITASNGSMTYGGTPPSIAAGYSGFVNGQDHTVLSTQPACTTTATSTSNAASAQTSSCSGAVGANYAVSYVAGTVTVNQAPLTITASNGSMTYGGTPPSIAARYSGFVNGQDHTVLSTQPTCTTTATGTSNAGSAQTSSCSGAGGANYSISYVAGTVTVNQAPVTITASNGSMTYGGTPPTITAGYSGFVNGQDHTVLSTQPACTTTATSTSNAASAQTSSCSGAVGANYAVSYVAGTVTVNQAPVTITASTTSTAYGTVPTVTAAYGGFVNGQTNTVLTTQPTCGSTVTAASTVGMFPGANTCSGAAATNYSFSYAAGDAAVTKAPVTITASTTSTAYGTVPTVTAAYSGFRNGQTNTVLTTQPTCGSTVTAASAVGSYPGANTCSGAAATNYSFSYAAGDATVTKAPVTITALISSTAYGTVPTVSASFSGFQNGQTNTVLTTQPTCGSTVTAASAVGNYTGANTCSGAAATNYSFSYVAGDATVTKAPVTITASTTSTAYGTVPTVTAAYGGFVNGQTNTVLTTQPTCGSTVTAASGVGSYPGANSCSGAAATNYSFSYVAGNATVTQASQAISFTGPGTGTVGNTAILTATGGASGNAVVFSIDGTSGTGVCTVSGTNGTTLNYAAPGNCVIDANQPGTTNYSAAPQVQQSVTVTDTLSFTNSTGTTLCSNGGTYVVPTGGVSFYVSRGTATSSSVQLTISGSYSGSLTIPANQTISSSAVAVSKPGNNGNATITASANGFTTVTCHLNK